MSATATYRPRHPERTPFYQCLEDYWEEFKQSYPYFYEAKYGPWRPVVEKTVHRFLECGIFRHGFARLKCGRCSHQALLAFSCKTRYFCPSCQAKRVAAFVEWVTEEVLEAVDHRQYVWTIPRVLRPAFRKDRQLLGRLSRCAWSSLRPYAEATLGEGFAPAAVVAIQTYGDTLDPHEHLHMLASDTAWRADGDSDSMGELDSEVLTRLFQHQVLEMVVAQRRLSRDFADKLRAWHPSGFSVYRGRPIDRNDRPALDRLAAYILRPSFAASRLAYDPEQVQIDYRTPKGVRRTLDALDWIALVTSHIPGPREQTTRYYGRYSNAARGKRRLAASQETAHGLPAAEDSEQHSAAEAFSRQRRRNWARLLRKVYEIDPLACPQSSHALEMIAVIEQPSVIEDILKHLDLWQLPQRAPPPRLFPQKLESFLASLSPQQAQAARTCNDTLFWDEVPTWED